MKILHFAFGSDPGNPYLPFNYSQLCSLHWHDNDTTIGWFNQLSDHEKNAVWRYLGCTSPEGIHWDLIRLALSSVETRRSFPFRMS